ELSALDFLITVKNKAVYGTTAQQAFADEIHPILAQYGNPSLGNVKLTFSATGATFVMKQPLEANLGPSSIPVASQLGSFPLKVYVVVFDPLLSNGQTLSKYQGWYDHSALTPGIT